MISHDDEPQGRRLTTVYAGLEYSIVISQSHMIRLFIQTAQSTLLSRYMCV